jgi:hypothetical protein
VSYRLVTGAFSSELCVMMLCGVWAPWNRVRLRARAATGIGIPKFNWYINYIFSNLVFLKGVKCLNNFAKHQQQQKLKKKNVIFLKSSVTAHFCIFWE